MAATKTKPAVKRKTVKKATAPVKRSRATLTKKESPKKETAKPKASEKDVSKSYNQFKAYEGKQYTGMKIGRSHKWYYDKGE